jgi:hypothetical protein
VQKTARHTQITRLNMCPASTNTSPKDLTDPSTTRVRPTRMRHAQTRTNLFTLTKNKQLQIPHSPGRIRSSKPNEIRTLTQSPAMTPIHTSTPQS